MATRLGFPAISTPNKLDLRALQGAISAARQRIEALEEQLGITTTTAQQASTSGSASLQTILQQIANLTSRVLVLESAASTDIGNFVAGSAITIGAGVVPLSSTTVAQADPSDPTLIFGLIGVALNTAAAGQAVQVQRRGIYAPPGIATLSIGRAVYVDATGLTQAPEFEATALPVGVAVSATQLFIAPDYPALQYSTFSSGFEDDYADYLPVTARMLQTLGSLEGMINALPYQSGADVGMMVPVTTGGIAVRVLAGDIAALAASAVSLGALINALPYSSGADASMMVPVTASGIAVRVLAGDIAALAASVISLVTLIDALPFQSGADAGMMVPVTIGGFGYRVNAGAIAALAGAAGITSVDASGGVQTTTGSPITTTGTIRGARVRNAQTGTSYALAAGDRGKHVTLSNALAIAVTVAQAGTTGFEDGYSTLLENIGVGNVTITPATSTINGAANIVVNGGMSCEITSDGTNYRAIVWQRGGTLVNLQTGSSYTYLSTDRGKLISHSNAATIGGTMPIATGAFGAGWWAFIQNTGVGDLVLTPTTSTIDGAANLTLTTGQGVLVASDGTNYFTMRGRPAAASALTYWTESLGTASPNGSINASTFTATSPNASGSAIIKWKGTSGFFAVQVPDATATGGNLSGALSINLNASRSTAAQVPSGQRSSIIGSQNCTVSGNNSSVSAGITIVVSANQSIGIGDSQTVDSDNTLVVGSYGTSRGAQSFVQSSGSSSIGRRQTRRFSLFTASAFSAANRNCTTTGSNSPDSTNSIVLPNNSVYSTSIRVTMRGGADYWGATINVVGYRGANAASTVINGVATAISATDIYKTAGVAGLGWAIDVIADTTNGGISIRTKGDTGQIVDSNVTAETTEMVP